MKDVVIVGGGLSGLAAAWRLRHWDTVLLESGSRVGGRIRSERRGRFWLNWGGHVFAGPGTSTDALLSEVGITAAQVPGALAAVSMNGKLLVKGPVHAYPFRIPMPLVVARRVAQGGHQGERPGAALRPHRAFAARRGPGGAAAAGLRLRERPQLPGLRGRPPRRRRGVVLPDRHPLRRGPGRDRGRCRDRLLQPRVEHRPGPQPGHHRRTRPPSPRRSPSALGERVQLEAEVMEIVHTKRSVVVRYRQNGVDHEVEGRCVVLATPATVSHRVAVDLPADIRDALGKVVYGPYVSAAFLTDEATPQPWDAAYGIATPEAVVQHRAEPVQPRPGRRDGAAARQQHHGVLARGPGAQRCCRRPTRRSCAPTPTTSTRSSARASATRSSKRRSSAGRPALRTASRGAARSSRP